jgi:hypothetical protein
MDSEKFSELCLEYSCWCLLNLPDFRQFCENLNQENKPDGDNNMVHQTFIKIAKQKQMRIGQDNLMTINRCLQHKRDYSNNSTCIIGYIIENLHCGLDHIDKTLSTKFQQCCLVTLTETETCFECNSIFVKNYRQSVTTLFLPTMSSGVLTLDHCMKYSFNDRYCLSEHCIKCNKISMTRNIKYDMNHFNNKQLILRFHKGDKFTNNFIEYPEELDISQYCYSYQNTVYILNCIYCFNRRNQCEYVILKKNNKWTKLYLRNNKIMGCHTDNIVTGDAHLLFYTRKE